MRFRAASKVQRQDKQELTPQLGIPLRLDMVDDLCNLIVNLFVYKRSLGRKAQTNANAFLI